MIPGLTKPQVCHGCGIGCARHAYKDDQGNRFKSYCQAIDIYRRPAEKYHDGWNDVILLAMRLCDTYGLDSSVMQAMIEWLHGVDGIEGEPTISFDTLRKIAEKFWGSAEAADFSSYEGKALAAKKIQDRTYAHESLIVCNARWPMIHNPSTDDQVGDPTLACRIYSAVTGRDLDVEELNSIGESIFNLQRAILLRQGWGGRDVETGLQTKATLKALELEDVADDLEERGLLR